MSARQKIRYGVIGLGHIAQVAVLPAFKGARRNSELTALITGDPTKAKKLGRKYKVAAQYDYNSFDELLRGDVIDALYVCLPNHLHTEYVMKALRAGIHVLCEKPLALSTKDCLKIADTSEAMGAQLMTAYRLHFEEANLDALKACKARKIGDVKYFSSDFSFQVTDPRNIRLRQEAGGGPVWDIGIYCINAARTIFQDEPEEVFAFSANSGDKRFQEVEESASVTMKFSGGRTANFTCSFGSDTIARYDVFGTKGSLRVENAYEYAKPRKLILRKDGKTVRTKSYPKSDQFAAEIAYFSDCLKRGKSPEPSAREGLADVRVIEAIYKSMTKGKPVRLDESEEHQGPHEDMKARFPGHPEPKTVNVQAPHS